MLFDNKNIKKIYILHCSLMHYSYFQTYNQFITIESITKIHFRIKVIFNITCQYIDVIKSKNQFIALGFYKQG